MGSDGQPIKSIIGFEAHRALAEYSKTLLLNPRRVYV
jgi:hypothetical protein